jgi:FkbM family methyltransferase
MKALVQAALRPFGLQLRRIKHQHNPQFGPEVLFSLLKEKGFAPRRIIDVGANHGHWTRRALIYFPTASYTLVEPQDFLKREVNDLIDAGRVQWINAGAGDEPGQLPFDVRYRDDCSSFMLVPANNEAPSATRVMVEVKTLDQIVTSLGLPFPELVKIDAEGFDLKVLRGATTLFGKTDVFLVEAAVCCPDIPNTALEVIQYMDRNGYKLIDITDLNRGPKDNSLWLCELVFLRKSSSLSTTFTYL